MIEWVPGTGDPVAEVWANGGLVHRDGDLPAKTRYDPETGIAVREEFWIEGQRHRTAGPARIERDRSTGVSTLEEWFVRGQIERTGDLPTMTLRNAHSGVVIYQEYRLDGELHRTTGPATTEFDADFGQPVTTRYYRRGVEICSAALHHKPSP